MADRVAVDIGGTFTDVVLETGQRHVTTKVLTSHAQPAAAVLQGLRQVLAQAGRKPSDVGVVLHGTTLATNALIERRGARTALITTEGHRDVLEMAFENRFEQYDINVDRPQALGAAALAVHRSRAHECRWRGVDAVAGRGRSRAGARPR